MTRNTPGLDLFDRAWPIPTANGAAMPSRFLLDERGRHGVLAESMIGSGCVIGAAAVDRRRFHVTPGGITLITPEMLGQRTWAPRPSGEA